MGTVKGVVSPPPAPALRPVAELALGVARSGEGEHPPLLAPPALRRYLSFARLPPAAQWAALRVLEDDEAFRLRVRDATTEDDIGELGWVFLDRPPGWEERLAEACGPPANETAVVDRQERRNARRQAQADAARSRFEDRARSAEAEAERLKAEASELRRGQRSAAAEVEKLSAELVRVNEDRSQAVRQLKVSEALATERSTEARKLRQQVADLEAALAMTAAPGLPSVGDPAAAGRTVDELNRAAAAAAEASSAAERLAGALSSAVAALSPATPADDSGCVLLADEPPRRPLRRVPVRLPTGIVDDTRRAAEHLLRLPGAIVLVDGYNVSKGGWPDLELGTQRLRLANGLAELRARTGVQVELVFDGVEQRQLVARGIPSNVRVRFSSVGVEADDLVLELVDDLPVSRPVIVVSSDKRVRDGARQRGASTLSSQTLLALLR
ncbi:MAG: hypothetical protein GEV08_06660 [Acidimicrobiia bacterium]|nr:hypothetical protein [Acidimicrobiia bacterium]